VKNFNFFLCRLSNAWPSTPVDSSVHLYFQLADNAYAERHHAMNMYRGRARKHRHTS